VSARPPAGRAAVLGLALAAGAAWHALLILAFLAAVLWAEEIGQAAVKALGTVRDAVAERARQRELDRERLELEAEMARRARPVPCPHEHPEDVRDLDGNLVACLCTRCLAQLPPDFQAVKEER
jgi:hypothetical protein